MNAEFLYRIMKAATYELKADTSTTYLFVEGDRLLPKTLSISRAAELGRPARTGRGLLPKVGQMKAAFTRAEESPYKQFKPFKVQTSIWPTEGYRSIFYGTIGITGPSGRIEADNGDLILFATSDWRRVRVAVFSGLAEPTRLPERLAEAAAYLKQTM